MILPRQGEVVPKATQGGDTEPAFRMPPPPSGKGQTPPPCGGGLWVSKFTLRGLPK